MSLVAGCGGPYESTVEGVVTLDGEPLTRGTVTFSPATGGTTAYARVGDAGQYRVQTGRDYGLAPGDYGVTIVARERPAEQFGKNGGPPPAGKLITPEWYRNADTSGLEYTIEPGSNEIAINLSSEPPPGWKPKRSRRR